MNAIAHNKAFAKKVGVPQSVGQDFSNADKGKTFKKGGTTMMMKKKPMMPVGGKMAADNQMMKAGRPQPGTPGMPMKKGGMAKDDKAQDKKMIKKAVGMHDKQQHGGKKTSLTTLKNGGMAMKKMAGGGLAAGHKEANGVAKKGLTKGKMVKMNMGGRAC